MGIEDTLVRIGERVKSLDIRRKVAEINRQGSCTQKMPEDEPSIFYDLQEPGISLLSDPEETIRSFVRDHPSNRFYIFNLGWAYSVENLISTRRCWYNTLVSVAAAFTGDASILKWSGVRIEDPPENMSPEERRNLRTTVPFGRIDVIVPELISMGYGVKMTPGATVSAHFDNGQYWVIGEVHIGNRVYIGAGSIIGPGVTIGDEASIKIGSIVNEDVPAKMIFSGRPSPELKPKPNYKVEVIGGTRLVVRS